jgi:cupin superfamily acireductone dioxygenase involved in methionine salvage
MKSRKLIDVSFGKEVTVIVTDDRKVIIKQGDNILELNRSHIKQLSSQGSFKAPDSIEIKKDNDDLNFFKEKNLLFSLDYMTFMQYCL